MTLKERIKEYAVANAFTGNERMWEDLVSDDGWPENLKDKVAMHYCFTFEDKAYYIFPKWLQKHLK